MAASSTNYQSMTMFSAFGERKYLTRKERARFYEAIPILESPLHETYVEMIYWTGCRPCEALGTTAIQIDSGIDAVTIRSAKKRGKLKNKHFRVQPVPRVFMSKLERVHNLAALQSRPDRGATTRLWHMSRTTAWVMLKIVMNHAQIYGVRACARGLRHTYGAHAVLSGIPMPRLQKWMGHASMETTACYLDLMYQEDRILGGQMWPELMAG